MSISTPKNKSQSVSTRTESLKARPTENRLEDDEISPSRKLSTLQVTNRASTSADADIDDNENKSKDEHEHPCVCDLNLPRKPLTNEERYAKAKDYLRNETNSKDDQSSTSPKMMKSIHASPADTESSNTDLDKIKRRKGGKKKGGKSDKNKEGKSDKNKGGKSDKMGTPIRKKLEKVYKILGDGYKIVQDNSEAEVEGINKAVGQKISKGAGSRSRSVSSRSSSSKSVGDDNTSPRKNIRWKKRPQIAVKLNRTAALRLEKGNNVYCGYKPPPVSKVDEYFAKRAKRIAAARAKAKAEALAAALKGKGGGAGGSGAGAGGSSGSTREEDFLAGQKCEYMRCRRYAKK